MPRDGQAGRDRVRRGAEGGRAGPSPGVLERASAYAASAGIEPDLARLGDHPIADAPVQRVRGRVVEVGVQEAERPAGSEQPATLLRDERRRVPVARAAPAGCTRARSACRSVSLRRSRRSTPAGRRPPRTTGPRRRSPRVATPRIGSAAPPRCPPGAPLPRRRRSRRSPGRDPPESRDARRPGAAGTGSTSRSS